MPDIPDRAHKEEALALMLRRAFGRTRDRIIDALGSPPDVANVPASTWDQLREEVADDSRRAIAIVFLLSMRRLAAQHRYRADPDLAGDRAARYAEERGRRLADSMVSTFRGRFAPRVQEAKQRLEAGDPRDQVEAGLRTAAEDIYSEQSRSGGVTEITDANSAGEMDWKEIYGHESGIALVAVWHAEPDACETCLQLNGQPEEVWNEEFPRGPTAHPNCRCWLTFEPAETYATL